jgi:hypothetical protein
MQGRSSNCHSHTHTSLGSTVGCSCDRRVQRTLQMQTRRISPIRSIREQCTDHTPHSIQHDSCSYSIHRCPTSLCTTLHPPCFALCHDHCHLGSPPPVWAAIHPISTRDESVYAAQLGRKPLFLCLILFYASCRGSGAWSALGTGLGFLTESNKPYSVNGVTGPILKSTTEVTWAGSTKGERVSHPVRGRLLATP